MLALAVLALSFTIASILVWIGAWRITTPQPHATTPECPRFARRLTRVLLIAAPPAWGAGVAFLVHTRISSPVILLALVPGIVSTVLLGFTYPRFAEGLLRRARARSGGGTARFLQFITLGWLFIDAAACLSGLATGQLDSAIQSIGCCGGFFALALYAFILMVLQSELAGVLQETAVAAKREHNQVEAATSASARSAPPPPVSESR